ncbi:nitroreductase [Sulfuricella sp. T08]|nr:nitroreductase [Sulfuricella sp. T08]
MPPAETEQVAAYHDRTKHRLDRYAAGPDTLDWSMQPNPFREFSGAPRIELPLVAQRLITTFSSIYQPGNLEPQSFSLQTVGALLELAMGLSAWKEYGPDRWALRCNPSSGNLHPTEAYLICQNIPALENGIYHYVSRDHALEQRCRFQAEPSEEDGRIFIGLSSIHWREAWKYGERAFRYCQLDVGHALGALRYAAGTLGWKLKLVEAVNSRELSEWLGLDRNSDFDKAEREEADLLLEVMLQPMARSQHDPACLDILENGRWAGKANVLDPHPMYRWPVIDEIATATRKESVSAENVEWASHPLLASGSDRPSAELILQRRSAQCFDATASMAREDFYLMLDHLLPRQIAPWDIWNFEPRVHPVLFVHRVQGLTPGLYVLPRSRNAEDHLRAALSKEFLWEKAEQCPDHLPLFLLTQADCRSAARTICCRQAIAADGCFSLGMLVEFDEVVASDPWRYRQLHWEAGLLGHVLYLEAEAMNMRGTGIGCFLDDAFHKILGITDNSFQSLYHFTVGLPVLDSRILTQPPYPDRDVGTSAT